MKPPSMEILLTAVQLDDLIGLPPGTIQRFVDANCRPPYVWHEGMSQPRWGKNEFSAWLRILHDVVLDGSDRPPLPNPHEVFGDREGPLDDAA